MRIPAASLPPMLQQNLKAMINRNAQVLANMIEQEGAETNALLHDQQEQDYDHANLPQLAHGGYTSEEDVEDLDADVYAAVIRDLQRDAAFSNGMDDFDDNEAYTSGLDHIDPISFFLESFSEATVRDAAVYTTITQELGNDFMTLCQALTVEAERRAKLLE